MVQMVPGLVLGGVVVLLCRDRAWSTGTKGIKKTHVAVARLCRHEMFGAVIATAVIATATRTGRVLRTAPHVMYQRTVLYH